MTDAVTNRPRRRSVAWRVHASLLLAAALPTILLSLVAYHLVSDALHKKALRESHQLARDIGMAVYERLEFAADELRILQHQADKPGNPGAGNDDQHPAPSPRLASFAWIAADNTLHGNLALSAAARASLFAQLDKRRRDQVSLAILDDDPPRVVMLAPRAGHPGALLAAAIDNDYLWFTNEVAERLEHICVLDDRNRPLYCNHSPSDRWRARSTPLLGERAPPRAIDDDSGNRVLTAAWAIFLAAKFQAPEWQVLVGVPETLGLGSIRRLAFAFSSVAAIAFLLAFWMGTRLIRAHLGPLGDLRDAIGKLASGRFDSRVEIDSADEFEQIGHAFNLMTRKIGDQFSELNALAQLYRDLQAARDPDRAIEAAARALHDLADGDFAIVCAEHWIAADRLRGVAFSERTTRVLDAATVDSRIVGEAASGTLSQLARLRPYLAQLRPPGSDDVLAGSLHCVPVCLSDDISCEIVCSSEGSEPSATVRRVGNLLGITLDALALGRRIQHLAHHDWLSGLPNRIELQRQFDARAAAALDTGESIGMLLIDINRFKQVNDSIGHTIGDTLLAAIAGRLRDAMPAGCLLARIAGDEFVVLLPVQPAAVALAQLEEVAKEQQRQLQRPFKAGPRDVELSASIGGALYPQHARSLEAMLQSLDLATAAAKTSRSRGYLMFSRSMRDKETDRWETEQALKGAVANDELLLHYQPVVDAVSGTVRSAEALMRWMRPGVGMTLPGQFIATAESSGLIGEMGDWAIGEACRQIRAWLDHGLRIETLNVNLSAQQLARDTIVETVQQALADNGIAPELLTLEVTETALMGEFDEASRRLLRLRELGVQILIDDFGTGYASLKYLKLLPVDGLKIDRLFVKELAQGTIDESIINAVVNLAEHSGFKLVAEGVETEAQAARLRIAGVPLLQGFLFDRALPADEFAQRLANPVVQAAVSGRASPRG